MDISATSSATPSVAETGTKVEEDATLLRRELKIEGATTTALIDSVPATTASSSGNLPSHLGQNVNTTA
jgi:hypothetical protein